MISKTAFVLSLIAGFGIGTPIARQAQDTSIQIKGIENTNAYYDLAALYGDEDQDGVLSADEFNRFDIEKVPIHQSNLINETFLGWIPTENKMYFYFHSKGWGVSRHSPWTSGATLEEALAGKNDWTYDFNYYDSTDQDVQNNIINDRVKAAKPEFINFYRGKSGYFYKFAFDYTPDPDSDFHRIKPAGITGYYKGQITYLPVSFNDEGEFFYDANYLKEDAVSKYFGVDTFAIDAVADMYLAIEEQKTEHIYLPMSGFSSSTEITKGREITYVFFNFQYPDDEEKNPIQDVKSVTYHANLMEFDAHHYAIGQSSVDINNGSYIPAKRIYSDTKTNLDLGNSYVESVNFAGFPDGKNRFTDHSENETVRSVTATTKTDVDYVEQKDNSYFFIFKNQQVRYSYFSNIVEMSQLDNLYKGEDWKNWKAFMHAGDHDNYQWAFRLNDNLHREFKSRTSVHTDTTMGKYNTRTIYDLVSSCHEYRDFVTLSMEVIRDNKLYSIKTMNNPISTRSVYLIGYPAPTITETIIGSITQEWPLWLKILVIAAVVVLALVLLRYIINFFKWLFGVDKKKRK